MDEAENERMHLMTFMELSNQRWHQRVIVVCGQGVFFAAYTLFYVLTPRIAHRFVGYLEEEAVHTYTEMLKMVDAGKIKNVPAPQIAIKYWNMPEDATLRDVILVVTVSVWGMAGAVNNYSEHFCNCFCMLAKIMINNYKIDCNFMNFHVFFGSKEPQWVTMSV